MRISGKLAAAAFAASVLAAAGQASAATITLTMDEVSPQSIDGLTVSKGGLDFTFESPDGTLGYNATGPGDLTYVNDPSIVGDASSFGVFFSAPVHFIQFGLAASDDVPAFTVTLSNGEDFSLDLSPLVDFPEGRFTWHGATGVTGFFIDPPGAQDEYEFAFDNLTVRTDVGAVPEPDAWALMLLGFGGLGAALRHRRRLAAV
jgi:hypothetical protein